ncbi:hypothetical protein Efla_001289 [Eimeria flavescens]
MPFEGVLPDPAKKAALKDFTEATNIRKFRSFVGLANYYRRFIQNYARIAKPLIALTHANEKIEWTNTKQETFDKIKRAVAEVAGLAHPRPGKPCVIDCDACKDGLGAVLAQADEQGKERPIAFASRVLPPNKSLWATTELEAYAVVWALDAFPAYYWPGMRSYRQTYVQSCPRCRLAKHVSGKPQGSSWEPQDPQQALCKQFQINSAVSSAWHPQTDGQMERLQRTPEQVFRTYIQSNETAWEDLLPAVCNCTTHTSTGLSPSEVTIGENPLLASDVVVLGADEPTLTPPMPRLFQRLVHRAAANIIHAQVQQQFYDSRDRHSAEFAVGYRVWVSPRYMQPRGSPNLQPCFIGPLTFVSKIRKVAYEVHLPAPMQIHPVLHVCLLQKEKPRPTDMLAPQGWESAGDASGRAEPRYEAGHILDSRSMEIVEE